MELIYYRDFTHFYNVKLTTCDEKQQWVYEAIGVCGTLQKS